MIRRYMRGNNLNIFVESKRLIIPSQESLNNLLIDLIEKFSSISIDEVVLKYKIPKKLVLLLIKLNVLISIDN